MALVELVVVDGAGGWSLWRAARLAALADAPDAFPGASAGWAEDGEMRWRERLIDPTALKVVAVRNGVPVGLVRGVVEDGCVWLHSLWVNPQVRGQGLGNRLVAAVEEWAVRQGMRYIRLEVMPDNGPAVALYRRHGYIDTGGLGELHPDGDRHVVMEKPLRAVGPIGPTQDQVGDPQSRERPG